MFLTHRNSLTANCYIPLSQYNEKKVIAQGSDLFLISNICPHQRSLISVGPGKGNRSCPYHSWAFDIDGNPLTSGRTSRYCENKDSLERARAYEWNSLIFSNPVEFDFDLDLSRMTLVEERIDTVSSSNNIIMDLFLDVDHIPVVHAGVYERLGLKSIMSVDWKFYNNGSIQTVFSEDGNLATAWISVYPNTMIEWQLGALFITVAIQISDSASKVHVFKFKDEKLTDALWKLNEDVWETAWSQDKTQAELITEFSDDNLEFQKVHFRQYLDNHGID